MDRCKHCKGPLGRHVETVQFKDPKTGRLLYHPHNFAKWQANVNGHLDSVVEWTQSARGSKEGLVTGYRYDSGKLGYLGEAVFCSMTCAAEAAAAGGRAATAGDASHARAINVNDLHAASKIDGAELRRIRQRLGLSQTAFAVALGYAGSHAVRHSIMNRLETGKRSVPDRVQLRAAILAKGMGA